MYKFDHTRLSSSTIKAIVAIGMFEDPEVPSSAAIIVEAGVRFVMDNGLYQYPPLNIDEIGESILPQSPKALRRVLEEVVALEELKFDGFYGRQRVKTADQLFYQILIQCIHEYGRRSGDLIEYVVLTHMDRIFDENAVETEHDMLIWSLLIEYLSDKLQGRSYPFGKFLHDRGGSDARFRSFLERNSWYRNPESFSRIFGITKEEPKPKEIIPAVIIAMARKCQHYEKIIANN